MSTWHMMPQVEYAGAKENDLPERVAERYFYTLSLSNLFGVSLQQTQRH